MTCHNINRLSRRDSLDDFDEITVLHVFKNLNQSRYFNLDDCDVEPFRKNNWIQDEVK